MTTNDVLDRGRLAVREARALVDRATGVLASLLCIDVQEIAQSNANFETFARRAEEYLELDDAVETASVSGSLDEFHVNFIASTADYDEDQLAHLFGEAYSIVCISDDMMTTGYGYTYTVTRKTRFSK